MKVNKRKLLLTAAVLLAIFGAAVYFDIWLMTIGGIVEIVNGVKADPTNDSQVTWGLLKVMFSGIGLIVAIVLGTALTAAIYGKSVRKAVGDVIKPPRRRRKASRV